jgi:1,4-dihydroxy-2-naphthoate polyprenyltransferase
MDTDRRAGKLTTAVRFGRSFAISEYIFCILAGMMAPFAVILITQDHKLISMAAGIGLLAIPCFKTICSIASGPALNELLAKTGRLLLIYSILFSIGWVLCSR